ncbi:MAG: sigma-54 dependent transcriptional regulator [Bacteroidetes bacterium]|nr:sigma-54 dependent transcriptional regulator [Bacteroidota bacterium]MBU1423659.1 sigma-54 dependent transcriptional regulator [Bacteroidota bacterium]MBU2472297.1 sigma-54 dependent transcriptional regulator [Bacteroidota bacterium]MBU2635770.1 sigma-54 dependent transcriptional regulator [Bacteroidota bacterium]
MKTILVVDDEKSVRDAVKMILSYEKYEVVLAEDGMKGLSILEGEQVDAILLDVKMPGMDGIEVLQAIKKRFPEMLVIMISGHGTIETAVEATKLGAFDFLPKPLDRDKLLITVRNALDRKSLVSEVRQFREKLAEKEEILGESPKIKEILALIERIAPTDSRVLITGDNGTGKELVARAIHRGSKRADKPIVEVNCAAIPTELIESELFGHEKGSFTGATTQRIGKFEQADGGTIFLDEIGDMSPAAQAKVLRVLEEGKIERVGGNRLIEVDVRVIAVTNKNLIEEIKKSNFREDLYHRINVIPIHVPSLRERREDIPILAKAFTEEICRRNGFAPKKISDRAINYLKGLEWSGNVRELRNIIERLVILTHDNVIEIDTLETVGISRGGELEDIISTSKNFQEYKDRSEALFFKRMLDLYNWNISKTAEALDIERSHLYSKMKKYGLERKEEN